jgi:hypothetical protein
MWANKKTINLRSTVAFTTDNAGEICLPGNPSSASALPVYAPGANSNSPLTLDGDSFNVGWVVGQATAAFDLAASTPSASDHRLAGTHRPDAATTRSFQIQAGTAAGFYRVWAAFCAIGVGTTGAVNFTLSDANGTLISQSALAALATTNVYDINGNFYATGVGWSNAADGGGVGFTFLTTDTSNGNGGPLLTLQCVAPCPLSNFAIQYLGTSISVPGWPKQTFVTQTIIQY